MGNFDHKFDYHSNKRYLAMSSKPLLICLGIVCITAFFVPFFYYYTSEEPKKLPVVTGKTNDVSTEMEEFVKTTVADEAIGDNSCGCIWCARMKRIIDKLKGQLPGLNSFLVCTSWSHMMILSTLFPKKEMRS